LSPHYGFYSDELYYLACADRSALGYVDHPPFFVWVLWLHRAIFGDSLFALRILPATAGAVAAFLTGWMTGRIGGGLYAQCIATLAMTLGMSMALFNFFSVNCLAFPLWVTASWIFLERCRSGNPRLWVLLGIVLGVAILTKHTIMILVAGMIVATVFTSLRRDLLTRWPWLGLLAFVVIASPNVYWQIVNDWPSLEFYRTRAQDNIPITPLQVLAQQIFVQNPATLPIWVGGFYFFLVSPRGRRFRPIGWLLVTVLAIAMIGGQSIPYRIAGVFPVAFAGGAFLLEAVRKPNSGRLRRVWNTYTLPAVLLLAGALASTLILPILPPAVMMNHPLFGGDDGWRVRIGEKRIPYHLANRTHWKTFADQVIAVFEDLDPVQRRATIILADYFGHAGAIEYYGRGNDPPPVYSPHTGYYLWGPPDESTRTVISIGIDESLLRRNFERVTVADVFECTYCPGWQDNLPIRIATAPTRPMANFWKDLGDVGGMHRYRRLVHEQEENRTGELNY
jgi:4-amino-4-deoxy-L-arabinose transferase-like glycosyltransferase